MLVLMKGSEEIQLVSEGGRFILANGDVVSPAFEGWSSGEYLLVPHTPAPPPQTDPAEALAAERAAMQCSRFQAKAALLSAGLLPQVEVEIAAADPMTQLAWLEAVEYRRNSPTILALAAALDLSDEQVDDLFRAAMQIEA